MRYFVFVLGFLLAAGCSHQTTGSGSSNDPTGDPTNGGSGAPTVPFAPSSLEVSGQVIDFETQVPLGGTMTMATAALAPPPTVTISGPSFTLDNVPPFSVFYLIAASPPDHHLTYNSPTTVLGENLTGVTAYSVSETYLGKLRGALGGSPASGTTTVLVHVVDGNGMALAGIPASALALTGSGITGPVFLDAMLEPETNGAATSASGWLAYFNVPAGTLTISGKSGYTADAADTPMVADSVALVEATLTKGTTAPPMNVSFQQTIVPIFVSRGCYNCHSGNGDGRRLGDLVLDGAPMKIWTALTQTVSPNFGTTRVNLATPEKSLVLTMPSFESPPDPHPTVVFTSSTDVDYQKILVWIKEGAKFN
ncbi:MAG TPA: hypothetical protein VN947_20775 [Polyangia bacterium]|nr:hypothetical protein [Polyangia bacterium]